MINATSMSTSARNRWLVYTSFYAIILSRLTILCWKSYFPISLPDFLRTFLIILPMNVPITSQSDQPTLQFVPSILTTQPSFLEYLYILLLFMQLQNFSLQRRAPTIQKSAGRERPATGKKAQGPYTSKNTSETASSSNCSRLSVTIQAGNSRSHCRWLKLVSKL